MRLKHSAVEDAPAEVERLRQRLQEAEETLCAIRTGQVDALVVTGPQGEQVFALKGAEQPYRVFVETMNEGAVTLFADGSVAYCNNRFAEMLQIPLEQIIGRSLAEFVPQDDRERLRSLVAQGLSGSCRAEFPLLSGEGVALCARLSLSPVQLENATGICLIASDITERKRAAELRSHLAAIVDSTDDAIIGKDLEGRILTWNAGAERLFGYSAGEMIGRPVTMLIPPQHTGEQLAILQRTWQGQKVDRFETERIRKDGECIEVSVTVSPLRDEKGRIEGASTIAHDITQRKRAEEALRASSDLLRNVIDSSSDYIFVKDRELRTVLCNQTFARGLGKPMAEICGKSDVENGWDPELVHGNPHKGIRGWEADDRAALQGEMVRTPAEPGNVGKNIRFFDTVKQPLRDRKGEIIGVLGFSRDITERLQAEEEVRRANAYNRSLIEASLDLLVTIAPDGKITDVNSATEKVTGLSRKELLGTDFSQYFSDTVKAGGGYRRVFEEGWVQDFELAIRHRDGHTTPVLYNASVYRDERGEVAGVFAAARDISERKRAEAENRRLNAELEERVRLRTVDLEAANQELESFSYSVSHDLRAPLRAISGFTNILLEEYAQQLPAEGQRLFGIVCRGAEQMGELITDLLAFSRLGREQLRKRSVAPAEVVRAALAGLASEQNGRHVEITVGELPVCHGDAHLLQQVFVNLLSNALKFTRARDVARIEVGAAKLSDLPPDAATGGSDADAIVYFVRDNGVGFDMRYADKLFGVFQRLHSVADYEGTGVGLATVKRIVHRHGGVVWASAAVNQGATFYFTVGPGADGVPAVGPESGGTGRSRADREVCPTAKESN